MTKHEYVIKIHGLASGDPSPYDDTYLLRFDFDDCSPGEANLLMETRLVRDINSAFWRQALAFAGILLAILGLLTTAVFLHALQSVGADWRSSSGRAEAHSISRFMWSISACCSLAFSSRIVAIVLACSRRSKMMKMISSATTGVWTRRSRSSVPSQITP